MTGEGTEALGGKRPPDSWGTGGFCRGPGSLVCPMSQALGVRTLSSPIPGTMGKGPSTVPSHGRC